MFTINALPSVKDSSEKAKLTYRQQFDLLDNNKDGKLSKDELNNFVVSIGWEPFYSDLIFKIFDKNTDGNISFLEFSNYLQCQENLAKNPRKFYEQLFKSIDANKNGFLCVSELEEFGKLVGMPIPQDEAERLIDQAPNKKFNFAELCKALKI